MSKATLARSLADEAGTTVARARRFIDDVGEPRAREQLGRIRGGGGTVDDSGRLVSNRALAIGGGAGLLGTTGALAWRQQDVAQTRAERDAAQEYSKTLQEIVNGNLTPEERQAALDGLSNIGAAVDGADAGGVDPGDLVPDLPIPDIGGSIIPTLVIILIALWIVSRMMDDEEVIPA
jgi:hypothetical protein